MKPIVHGLWSIPNTSGRSLGWPTLARTGSGGLVAVFSANRMHHVCPFGQVHFIESDDNGKTWAPPRTIIDGPLDDRDAGILQTASGALLVNWFSSLTWRHFLHTRPDTLAPYSPDELAQWRTRDAALTDDIIHQELGVWCTRSTDSGRTWSPKIDTIAGSPHGPLQLSTGALLYPGKKKAHPITTGAKLGPYSPTIGASLSTDDGRTWQWLSDISPMPGHDSANYHELHGIQAADGRIVVHIRNHNDHLKLQTLQTHSTDNGHTWSPIHPTGIWGYPAFLTKTSSGRLITSVSHRKSPHGIQVSISDDHGQTWSPQQPLTTDSSGDFGYPSTVELSPNLFLTLWYDQQPQPQTTLRLARWSLP